MFIFKNDILLLVFFIFFFYKHLNGNIFKVLFNILK